MSEHNLTYQDDDEINLFELVALIWSGRWIISLSIALASSIGAAYLMVKDNVYQSNLEYAPHTVPPFYVTLKNPGHDRLAADFEQLFYDRNLFDQWRLENPKATLAFDDFYHVELVDGVALAKRQAQQLAYLVTPIQGNPYIYIQSGELTILDEFNRYAEFINAALTQCYIARALTEIALVENRYNDSQSAYGDVNLVRYVLSIDRYVERASQGSTAFTITPPTNPIKIAPNVKMIAFLAVLLGGFGGCTLVFLRNALEKRRLAVQAHGAKLA